MYRIGLDLGSSYTKGVLVDDDLKIMESMAVKTGLNFRQAGNQILEAFSNRFKIQHPIHTCGYGRNQIRPDATVLSEITCLAKATYQLYPKATTVLDIGGQDTKLIHLSPIGNVEKFKLNRKCAAGTGSFLEEIAYRLNIPENQFSELSQQAQNSVKLNSYCTVFAISEIIGLIKKGHTLPEIAQGVYLSIIERCKDLVHFNESIILTGGIPKAHPAFVTLFKSQFPNTIVPEYSQFLAAYGCVLTTHFEK